MKWVKKHIIVFLGILGLLLLAGAVALFAIEESPKLVSELAKAFMTLSTTIIFGGIIKLIFEVYQDDNSAREKNKGLKKELVHQLRNVFDKVDNTRLLIKAHKSART